MSEHWQFLNELVDEARHLAGDGLSPLLTFPQICDIEERRRNVELSLPPGDPRHPRRFEFNRENREYLIYWGGYAYPVHLDQMATPIDFLQTLHHLCEKGWAGTNGRHVRALIGHVAHELGWDLHGRTIFKERSTTADEERAKLTPQLRYSIFKRDGFRCRCCGRGAADGVLLHVDHKIAIANGGRTERENLQTLCSMCNIGKGRTQ